MTVYLHSFVYVAMLMALNDKLEKCVSKMI
jgi:hypothetical protein